MHTLKTALILLLFLTVISCDMTETEIAETETAETGLAKIKKPSADPVKQAIKNIEKDQYVSIEWDALIPEGYSSDVIIEKYREQLDNIEDDTDEAEALFQKISAEINRAPLNEKMTDKAIKLNGFIAPLNQQKGMITEFLLVPYFGACIHVPPPPNNQTVLVKTKLGEGIKLDEAYLPFTIVGVIITEGKKTEIGEAGYSILNASIEPYEEEIEGSPDNN